MVCSNILNFGARLLKKKIKSLITAQICVKAKAEINDKAMYALNRMSSKLKNYLERLDFFNIFNLTSSVIESFTFLFKVSETIEKVYDLDFHLVKWPGTFKDYAQLYHKVII